MEKCSKDHGLQEHVAREMTERASLADKVKQNAERMCQLAEEREVMTRKMLMEEMNKRKETENILNEKVGRGEWFLVVLIVEQHELIKKLEDDLALKQNIEDEIERSLLANPFQRLTKM
eukprot:750700-Hanusia_phi.AAC.10